MLFSGEIFCQQLFPTTVLCPRLVAGRLPPDANLHGNVADCGMQEGSMHSGSHDQNNNAWPGTAKAAKSLVKQGKAEGPSRSLDSLEHSKRPSAQAHPLRDIQPLLLHCHCSGCKLPRIALRYWTRQTQPVLAYNPDVVVVNAISGRAKPLSRQSNCVVEFGKGFHVGGSLSDGVRSMACSRH